MSIFKEDELDRVVSPRSRIDWNKVMHAVATHPHKQFKNRGERYVLCYLRWELCMSLSEIGQLFGLLEDCVDTETMSLEKHVRGIQASLSKQTNRTAKTITRGKKRRSGRD